MLDHATGSEEPCCVSVKLLKIVAAFISSEKVASTLVFSATPIAAFTGVTPTTVGAVVSTVQVRLAGVGSVLPAEPTALTSKVCVEPPDRPRYSFGEVQTSKAPSSSLHSKVARLSLEEKPKVVLVLASQGSMVMEVIVVSSGGQPSKLLTCAKSTLGSSANLMVSMTPGPAPRAHTSVLALSK